MRCAARRSACAATATPPCATCLPIRRGTDSRCPLGRLVERRSWRGDLDSAKLAIMAEPARVLAYRVLTRVWRKAMKQGRHFRHLEPEARHRLRLTLKKLRYTTEFFQSLHGASAAAQKYLKRLSKLQDALGAANDVA